MDEESRHDPYVILNTVVNCFEEKGECYLRFMFAIGDREGAKQQVVRMLVQTGTLEVLVPQRKADDLIRGLEGLNNIEYEHDDQQFSWNWTSRNARVGADLDSQYERIKFTYQPPPGLGFDAALHQARSTMQQIVSKNDGIFHLPAVARGASNAVVKLEEYYWRNRQRLAGPLVLCVDIDHLLQRSLGPAFKSQTDLAVFLRSCVDTTCTPENVAAIQSAVPTEIVSPMHARTDSILSGCLFKVCFLTGNETSHREQCHQFGLEKCARLFLGEWDALAHEDVVEQIMTMAISIAVDLQTPLLSVLAATRLDLARFAVDDILFRAHFLPVHVTLDSTEVYKLMNAKRTHSESVGSLTREGSSYVGGMVLDAVLGIHAHTAEIDFDSAYPSIIAEHGVLYQCPKEEDAERLNGALRQRFSAWVAEKRERGSSLLARATKLKLVSFYGCMGRQGTDIADMYVAARIAESGRDLLTRLKSHVLARRRWPIIMGHTDALLVARTDFGDKESVEEVLSGFNQQFQTIKVVLKHEFVWSWVINKTTHVSTFRNMSIADKLLDYIRQGMERFSYAAPLLVDLAEHARFPGLVHSNVPPAGNLMAVLFHLAVVALLVGTAETDVMDTFRQYDSAINELLVVLERSDSSLWTHFNRDNARMIRVIGRGEERMREPFNAVAQPPDKKFWRHQILDLVKRRVNAVPIGTNAIEAKLVSLRKAIGFALEDHGQKTSRQSVSDARAASWPLLSSTYSCSETVSICLDAIDKGRGIDGLAIQPILDTMPSVALFEQQLTEFIETLEDSAPLVVERALCTILQRIDWSEACRLAAPTFIVLKSLVDRQGPLGLIIERVLQFREIVKRYLATKAASEDSS